MSAPDDTTRLLRRIATGDREAEGELIPRVYQDLRQLAAHHLRGERSDHTLQPTALVHEAYIRLLGPAPIDWQDRPHFFRIAANVMRRILVDHARTRRADKRGGAQVKVLLDEFLTTAARFDDTVLDLDRALTNLAEMDERQARIVEMRFFAGLSEEEIGSVLNVSSRTVKREWALAKAWLYGEMSPPAAE